MTEPGIGRLPSKYTGFSKISDAFARDGALSMRARSVGLYILSHREGFHLTQRTIAAHLNMSRTTVRAALDDLRDAGYMRSWTVRNEHGHVAGTRYVVDDQRHDEAVWNDFLTSLNTDSDLRDGLGPDSQHRDSVHRESGPPKGDHSSKGHQNTQGHFSSPPADAAPDQPASPADTTPERPDVERLCVRLRDHVIANGAKPPTITDTWRRDARLLLDRDGRRVDHALNLIDWCQNDHFWAANVLSMGKFRKQYDQLALKARAEWRRNREQQAASPTSRAMAATDAAWNRYDQQHATNGHTLTGRH